MLHLKKKHLKISLSKSGWYDQQFLRYRAKQTEIGKFRSFFAVYPTENPKNQHFENESCWRNHQFTHVRKKSQSYDVRFLRYRVTKIFVILGHFLPFYHLLMILNIKILKKGKKCLEILSFYTYMCTINEDHMTYGSWNIRCHRHKFFSPLTTWKIKILTLQNKYTM